VRLEAITFVVLTRNEEHAIAPMLSSLPVGCERLVVDACSSDRTIWQARRAGARVIVRPWRNFVDARNFALTQVRTPWLFMLDADERLDARLGEALSALKPYALGYRCCRRNRFVGRVLHAGPWADEQLVRLVRTAAAQVVGRDGGTLHERLVVPGETPVLDGSIEHDSYPTLRRYWTKFDAYTSIEAAERPYRRRALWIAAMLLPFRVLWYVLRRGGWRDGWRGFFVAAMSACYPVVVQWKIWQRRR